MFKISTPQPHHSFEYVPQAGPSSSRCKNAMCMDLDEGEDPSMSSSQGARVTIPGEPIADAANWMRGHGTYVEDEMVLSTVSGVVERVNKLISVRALRSKYRPEVGDLVIGRITEVGPRRWRVDANGRLEAVLMLSSINLPGGVQRRKLESDELQMRTFFQEGDLLVAEVQALMGEGTMSLHTRSLKYGKLRNGTLVKVPPTLIVRLKSHFHTLPCGVDVILGLNGYIWVQAPSSKSVEESGHGSMDDERGEASASMAIYSSTNDQIPESTRTIIDRVAICIQVLGKQWIPVSDSSIQRAYEISLQIKGEDEENLEANQLLEASVQTTFGRALLELD